MQATTMEHLADEAIDDQILVAISDLLPRLYNHARYLLPPEDARDAVSAAIEHLWRNRVKYRARDEMPIERWATRVAFNKIRDEARRHRRRASHVSAYESDIDLAVGDGAEQRAILGQIRQGIDSLPQRDADLIALRYGADLSNHEIAELLHTTPGAVAVALHRAIQRLRATTAEEHPR